MAGVVFLVMAILFACAFGSGTQSWTWGFSLAALGVAATLFVRDRAMVSRSSGWLMVTACIVASYFLVRAWLSPVWDFALSDLLLISSVVVAGLIGGCIQGSERHFKGLLVGLALVVGINGLVALIQIGSPDFMIVPGMRLTEAPSGLFTQYSYFSNFMMGSGLLLLASAILIKGHKGLRCLWGTTGVLACVTIALTWSRGGKISLAIGLGLLLVLVMVVLSKRSKRAFAVLVVGTPLLVVAGAGLLVLGLMKTQENRGYGESITELSDNSSRLHFMGVAAKGIGEQPLLGGGAQSFRWRAFELWEVETWGKIASLPEFIHNEPLQVVFDYGLVGGVLLLLLLFLIALFGVAGLLEKSDGEWAGREAVLVGALAGLGAMLFQSNFSFVFHTLPSAILLGLLSGLIVGAVNRSRDGEARPLATLLMRGLLVVFGIPLLLVGIQGARTQSQVIASGLGDVSGWRKASELWPSSEFFLRLGHDRLRLAYSIDEGEARDDLLLESLEHYEEAERRFPYDPEPWVNRANVFALLGKDEECRAAFVRAVELQGAFEASFRARHYYGEYLFGRASRLVGEGKTKAAKADSKKARHQLKLSADAVNPGHFPPNVVRNLRLATWRLDDTLSGYLEAEKGFEVWQQREPEKALAHFLEAERLLASLRDLEWKRLPEDSSEMRLLEDVREKIKFLEGAGIVPESEGDSVSE